MAFAESRQELEGIIEKLSGKRNFMRAFDFATADSRAEKEYIGIKNGEYAMFGRLLPPVFYGNICGSRYVSPRTRCKDALRALWCNGISGDRPIVSVFVRNTENGEFIRRAVRFKVFAAVRGVPIDMVIVADDNDGYMSPVKDIAECSAAVASGFMPKGMGDILGGFVYKCRQRIY